MNVFLVKVNSALHEKMGVIKEFLTILILLAIRIGFQYNHFSKDDLHLLDSFFHNLYKLLSSPAGVPISLETGDDPNRQWEKIVHKVNFRKN